MAKKQIHYNCDNISKENANINLIYGEKSNGKSYQMKDKKEINPYLESRDLKEKNKDVYVTDEEKKDNEYLKMLVKKEQDGTITEKEKVKLSLLAGDKFILLRRWKEDITNMWIEQYFADMDIEKMTKGRYNCITQYKKILYLSNYDFENNKVKRGEKIGYVMALSTEQHYSGGSFLDVRRIIFEEFMERGSYLPNEVNKLMTLYSTIDRKRGTTELWLVGNSISRVCPYIGEWGLDDIFRTLQQGEIKTKIIHNEENDVKIAVEYCKSSGGNTMAIGNASSMIDKGSWQTFPQPHLPKSYKEYKVMYRFGFQYQSFRFLCEYLVEKDSRTYPIWFIKPFVKDFSDKIIVFSDTIKVSKYWQRDIYNISIKNDKLRNLFMSFKENNIFYSDDMCGTDFKQVIDFQIRR